MNRLTTYLLFIAIFFISSFTAAKEPDESGIGGTGVNKPSLEDGVFNRPEIPEFMDIPEAPDISVPEFDGALGIEADVSIDEINIPEDTPD